MGAKIWLCFGAALGVYNVKQQWSPMLSVLTICGGPQCSPEVCEESLGEGPSQREVVGEQLGQEDRGKTEGKAVFHFLKFLN